MKNNGFVEGTHNVTFIHIEDERRHKNRCIYHTNNNYCNYYDRKCTSSSHCGGYEEIRRDAPFKEKNSLKIQNADKIIYKPDKSIIGELIIHKKYGLGIVEELNDSKLLISFENNIQKYFDFESLIKNGIIYFDDSNFLLRFTKYKKQVYNGKSHLRK